MEEILFDPSQFSISSEDLASLQEVMTRSKTEGVQVGIPWNKVVYDDMFESGVFMDPSILLGDDYFLVDVDDDNL